MKVRIADVIIDHDIQLQARGIDQATVQSYVEALSNEVKLPAVVAFSENGNLWLSDGFHRIQAYKFLGLADIEADVKAGTRQDAMIYAALANVVHGKPMSQKEKREAGERLLTLTNWSNAEIGRRLAVSDVAVLQWRSELSSNKLEDNASRTVTRGGTTYTMDTSNIGKPQAPATPAIAYGEDDILKQAHDIKAARQQLQRQIKQESQRAPISLPDAGQRYRLIQSDIAELDLAEDSVDVIITDPPYQRQYIHLYGALAKLAAKVLKGGGSLLAMSGQFYLPEVVAQMTPHLAYHWLVAYLTPGGQSPQIWPRRVNSFWKPVVWFVKGDYTGDWIGDVCKSATNDNDKRFHEWGQSVSGMADLISRFSQRGQTILDPFVGGGATAEAALKLERLFIGSDIDRGAIDTTLERIAQLQL